MRRFFLIVLSLVMLITGSGIVRAEESQELKNLTDSSIKNVMKNTVMIYPDALDSFAFGKKISMENYGEAKRDGNKILVSGSFLKDVFPEKNVDGEWVDIYEFTAENNLKAEEKGGVYYISDTSYRLPSTISSQIIRFFGIYVKEGSKGIGTLENPAGSMISAKNIVSSLKKSVGLPDGGVTVYFREGKYVINSTINFNESDGGMEGSPVTYKAYKNENAAFNGGLTIRGTEFGEISDVSVKKKLPYPDKVVAAYIGDKISGFGDSFKTSDPALWSVFYNDSSLNVARWPNTDWELTGEILIDSNKVRGKGFSFVVGDTRVKKWGMEDDPRVFGYFGFDWAGERRGIASVDSKTLSILTDNYAEYGISSGKRYYVYNMLCELDNPGEFYYDKKTDYLYFYPVEGDPKDSRFLNNEIQFSLLSQEMFVMKETSYVTFENMIFENSLSIGMNVSETCKNINVKGCVFKNIAQGIDLYGFNNTVESCDFYNISNRPLGVFGGDRNTLTHSGNVIKNNKFWNFNIASRTNTGAISVKGCGDLVTHNEISGSPHTAVVIGGNDNIVEYNELYNNLVDQAHDAGMMYGGRNLSELGNVYRYNYFHDAACHSIGVIYFDDGMSGNSVETNVFENTGTGVFVHGGVETVIKDNLFINGTGNGAGYSSVNYSWKMETVDPGNLSSNTFLWWLIQFPWKSDVWQKKYQNVFQYIESDEKPIFMRSTFTGNIAVNKSLISAPDADKEYMTIENNTEIPAEEAANYEIPEKYREIMEKAGVYEDKYRKMDALGDFSLQRPYHKENNVDASEVYFEWEKADDAFGYQFTLATDKEFKNIISNKIVTGNALTLQKLNYFNTRYYWKVKAIANNTNSVVGEKEKKSREEYFSFTTKAVEVINKEKLYDQIEYCQNQINDVVEGTNSGEYKEGTVQLMTELVNKYKKSAESETITQKDINKFAADLKKEFETLTYRKNAEMFDMAKAVGQGNLWSFTPNQTVFTKDKLSLTYENSQALGSLEKISPHVTYKFKIRWDGYNSGWLGIGILAQGSPTAVPWSGNPMYFTILKKDTVEFQKWGSGENINNSYPNIYTKTNEWAVYELSAVAQDDGTNLVTWKIDGQTVVEYMDNDLPITTPGFLYFYNGVKGATLDIMPVVEETTEVVEED